LSSERARKGERLKSIHISLILAALLANASAWACVNPAPLDGVVHIVPCDPAEQQCQSAAEALHVYAKKYPKEAAVFSVAVHSSPWRIYDGDQRIIPMDEMAAMIKPRMTGEFERVKLLGSWTGLSLAGQLSRALGGKVVDGMDGFVWYTPDGTVRTTRQAFTMRAQSGPYVVAAGQDVMAALVVGAYVELEAAITAAKDGAGLLHLGVAHDVYMLCPDRALRSFQDSAAAGNAIGAYNAGIMLLERNGKGDRSAGLKLLRKSAALGDVKARQRIAALRSTR
jgi:TPR repeat protein